MREVNRAAVVVGILVAGALTIAQAREGDAMTNGAGLGIAKGGAGCPEGVCWNEPCRWRALLRGSRAGCLRTHLRSATESGRIGSRGGRLRVARSGGDGTVEIKGVNGDIIAERSAGGEIEVRAERSARRSDPEAVRIEVIEHAGGVTVCAVYPSSRGRENTCEPGSRGRNSTRNNDVRVTFYVSVPEDVGFLGKTVNGDVRVHDLASEVGAKSVNGDIEISTSGFPEASTVNGSIDAAMERYDIASGLSFSTVNGSISLDLPDDVDADLDARWVNGRLETDLPLELIGRVSRRSARGALGDGGPELNLRTVNGSIHLF